MKQSNVKKIITHDEIQKRIIKGLMRIFIYISMGLFCLIYACCTTFIDINYKFTNLLFLLLSFVVSILFIFVSFLFFKNNNKGQNYSITLDKVIKKDYRSLNTGKSQVEITFEKSGSWVFYIEKMYDKLKLGSEIFVVKNMENFLIVAVFETNDYEISPEEFEFKNSRYYSIGYTGDYN